METVKMGYFCATDGKRRGRSKREKRNGTDTKNVQGHVVLARLAYDYIMMFCII